MKNRAVNMAFAVALFLFGAGDIITKRGSHVLSESTVYRYKWIPGVDVRYTGAAAFAEGVIFIGGGILFLYRALARRGDGERSDLD